MYLFKPKQRDVSNYSLNAKSGFVNADPTFGQNLKAYISHFCNTTTIHGVKYIGEKGRYLVESLIWLCTVVTVCSVCVFFITNVYLKWKTSPVMVSFETKETPIFAIPFPAVTICPEIKIDPEYFNFTDHVLKKMYQMNVTEREERLFSSILLVCEVDPYYIKAFGIEYQENFIDEDVYLDWFLGLCPFDSENDTLVQFLGKDAMHLIRWTITEEGFCHTFNMLPLEDILRYADRFITSTSTTLPDVKIQHWSLEKGYLPGDNLDSYPKRTFMPGLEGGLVIDSMYINHSQLDNLCLGGVRGFKITLHHPSELPNMDKHFRLPLNHLALVAVKPSMITVSNELLNYDPKVRECYFSEEKTLSLYKVYTQENCLAECLSNFTLTNCDCVSFWMPHMEGTKICGPGKQECLKKSKVDYLSYTNRYQKGAEQCECLPSCTSLSYDIETSQANWDWQNLTNLYILLNMSNSNYQPQMSYYSKLVVYYKDLQFLTSRRHELYGVVDFFSNVGGLLGLFIGFSVVSAIEITYFLTLRIVCNVKRYGKTFWSGQPDLVN